MCVQNTGPGLAYSNSWPTQEENDWVVGSAGDGEAGAWVYSRINEGAVAVVGYFPDRNGGIVPRAKSLEG